MAVTAASFSTGSTPSLTVSAPAPAGVVAGDLLMIWVTSVLTTVTLSITAGSSGWNAVTANNTGQNFVVQLFWKNADATDVSLSGTAGSYTITASSSRSIAGIIVNARGGTFDPSTPASSGQTLALTATSYPVTGVTTVNNGDLLLLFAAARIASGAPGAMTLPGGWTTAVAELNTTAGASANLGVMLGTQVQSTSGATGTQTVNLGTTEDGGGLLVAVTQPVSIPVVARTRQRVLSRQRGAISRPAFIPVTVTVPVTPAPVRTRRTVPRPVRSRMSSGIAVSVQPIPAPVRTRRAIPRPARSRMRSDVAVTVQPIPGPVRTRRIVPRLARSRITPGIVVTIVASPVQPVPAPVRTRRVLPRLSHSRITPGIVVPAVVVTIPVIPAPTKTRRFARVASRGRIRPGIVIPAVVVVPVPIVPAQVRTRRIIPRLTRGRITAGVVVVVVITPPPDYGTSRVTGTEIYAWITGTTDKIRVTGRAQSSETQASQGATPRVTGSELL